MTRDLNTEDILNFYILNKNILKQIEKLEFIDFLIENHDKIKKTDKLKSLNHELVKNIDELENHERILYIVKLSKFFGKNLKIEKYEKIKSSDFTM